MNKLLRWPLIIAAIVVVARVVAERNGATESVTGILGVYALTVFIVPVYLALRIAMSGAERPYSQLFVSITVYAVLVRAMVLPTYWFARIFEWPEPRFDGTWGPDVGPMVGFLVVPILTAVFWILTSVVIGGGLGALVLALTRPRAKK